VGGLTLSHAEAAGLFCRCGRFLHQLGGGGFGQEKLEHGYQEQEQHE
jgi:hypothetical protein